MEEQADISARLQIDPEKTAGVITDFIRERFARERRDGVLLGLSGGIDSAAVASLAVRAAGAGRVYAMHLFDRDSDPRSYQRARAMAADLGVSLEAHRISEMAREMGIPRPGTVSPFSAAVNRLLYAWVGASITRRTSEDPFVWILRREDPQGWFTRWLFRTWILRGESRFDAKHKLRRAILEADARRNNRLLLGAANRTEAQVGWFVKDGVDDLPVEPILGLYKTQVRQIGQYLGLPREMIDLPPSPDMTRGVTDEMVIGFSYEHLDIALYAIEHGLGPKTAYRAGVTPREFEGIKKLITLSAWKRANPHDYPEIG